MRATNANTAMYNNFLQNTSLLFWYILYSTSTIFLSTVKPGAHFSPHRAISRAKAIKITIAVFAYEDRPVSRLPAYRVWLIVHSALCNGIPTQSSFRVADYNWRLFDDTDKQNHPCAGVYWLRKTDLNRWPSGYDPDELPNCSIPLYTARKNMIRGKYDVLKNRADMVFSQPTNWLLTAVNLRTFKERFTYFAVNTLGLAWYGLLGEFIRHNSRARLNQKSHYFTIKLTAPFRTVRGSNPYLCEYGLKYRQRAILAQRASNRQLI